jgi:hypothetical protein
MGGVETDSTASEINKQSENMGSRDGFFYAGK